MPRIHVTRITSILSLLVAIAVPALPDSFYVSINTSASGLNLQGPGVLAFELSDSPSTTDKITVGISGFSLDGGTPGSVIASQGVTGSFTGGSTSLTVKNGVSFGLPTQTSFYEQKVTFGSKLSLQAGFTFTPPSSGAADSTSDFLIVLGPPDFPKTQISAVDFMYDADGGLTLAFANPRAATVTPIATPEPAFFAPLGLLVVGAVLAWRRLRRFRGRNSVLS